MKRENIYKRILYGLLLGILLLGMSACGRKDGTQLETQQSESQTTDAQTLYMITLHDTREESLCLRELDTGVEQYYSYGMPTRFKDKYGNICSSIAFVPGKVVTIGNVDNEGILSEVMISDEVWEYEKVRKFSIDEEKGVFTIADTKYSIRDKVMIFSNGKQIPFAYLSKEDVLTVIGRDKKILSINVTTGHGTLSLSNTDLFVDSFLQLNTDIFTLITGDMELELPEGRYTLKVANDGWGGTTEIEIVRDQTTEIDLDTLKGEGKKKGLVSFDIDADNVKVYIDNQLVDHTKAVELTYGLHVLQIKADGYETWKNYLSVNSEEATLMIELTEDDEKTTEKESESESTEKKDSEDTQKEETENSEKEDADNKDSETESSQKKETDGTEEETSATENKE